MAEDAAPICWVCSAPSCNEFPSVCDTHKDEAWRWARCVGLGGHGGWLALWLIHVKHVFEIGDVHVLPLASPESGRPHVRSAGCWCGPQTSYTTFDARPVLVHRLSPRHLVRPPKQQSAQEVIDRTYTKQDGR
jgi:hypothetical protein